MRDCISDIVRLHHYNNRPFEPGTDDRTDCGCEGYATAGDGIVREPPLTHLYKRPLYLHTDAASRQRQHYCRSGGRGDTTTFASRHQTVDCRTNEKHSTRSFYPPSGTL